MLSLFLNRISVIHVYLSIAATTQDPAGQDPHHRLDVQDQGMGRYEFSEACVYGLRTAASLAVSSYGLYSVCAHL